MIGALFIFLGSLIAYLLGSIPTAVWLGRAQFGIDIRDYGSGNAGATNTFRVLGKKAGSLVMAVDVFKGFTATALAGFLLDLNVNLTDNQFILCQLFFGILAVVGHIFPLFAKFKGGKGVATLLGMVLAVNLPVALACLAIFVLVFLTTKYVSLGSILAALSFPLMIMIPRINPDDPNPLVFVFGIVMFSVVVFTHQKNIRRLIKGNENKARIFRGRD